jgi:hypothetical protein
MFTTDSMVALAIGIAAGFVLGLLVGRARARTQTPKVEAARPAPKPEPPKRPKPEPPARSEAITLLAALQREARFVDFIQEPLGAYSDAQIGAAARDVHRDCGAVLERMFALQPIVDREEGAEIEVPAGFDPGRYRLTGNVAGEPPFRGPLVHHGWEATRCELPAWSGSKTSARVVAPAEVELKP